MGAESHPSSRFSKCSGAGRVSAAASRRTRAPNRCRPRRRPRSRLSPTPLTHHLGACRRRPARGPRVRGRTRVDRPGHAGHVPPVGRSHDHPGPSCRCHAARVLECVDRPACAAPASPAGRRSRSPPACAVRRPADQRRASVGRRHLPALPRRRRRARRSGPGHARVAPPQTCRRSRGHHRPGRAPADRSRRTLRLRHTLGSHARAHRTRPTPLARPPHTMQSGPRHGPPHRTRTHPRTIPCRPASAFTSPPCPPTRS